MGVVPTATPAFAANVTHVPSPHRWSAPARAFVLDSERYAAPVTSKRRVEETSVPVSTLISLSESGAALSQAGDGDGQPLPSPTMSASRLDVG